MPLIACALLRSGGSAVGFFRIGLEVTQILIQLFVWVAEKCGHKFTELASWRHILQHDRDFGLPLRELIECDLPAGLDIAAITAIPGDALIWFQRGRLGIPLQIFPKRAFHNPMARALASLGD